jgi:hypothetical protein
LLTREADHFDANAPFDGVKSFLWHMSFQTVAIMLGGYEIRVIPRGANDLMETRINKEREKTSIMNYMMNADMGMMMVGMFLGTTLWLLLLAALIWVLIIWLNRQWAGRHNSNH